MVRLRALFGIILALACAGTAGAQTISPALDGLPALKDYEAMRSSSADPDWRNGNGDARAIEPGQTLTLAELAGPGRIAHIWFTIADNERFYGKKLVLRMYWDGEKNPSVESPINDFFCQGHGLNLKVNSLPFRVTSNGKARNCYFPMPFRKSARIEIANEGKAPAHALYWYIDWQKLNAPPKDAAYFHAKYRQEFPCRSGEDYLILSALGRGHYVGCNLSVRTREPGWWGEGDDRFYIDGEAEPRLRGTGSEDYFCDAWGIREMEGLFYGCTIMEGWDTFNRITAYRFHIQDPVPFKKSLKVTIEHKGARQKPDGSWVGFVERADDFSSVAYWYQTEPHVEFTKMPPAEERLYPSNAVAVEGESLAPSAEANGPKPAVQHLAEWSGDAQLFFTPDDEKAWVAVKLSVPTDGNYQVWVTLTRSWDYGIYRAYLDDNKAGKPMDLYSAEVVQTPKISLGRYKLSAGGHTLKFQCEGKSPASKGYCFGLDLVELTPENLN